MSNRQPAFPLGKQSAFLTIEDGSATGFQRQQPRLGKKQEENTGSRCNFMETTVTAADPKNVQLVREAIANAANARITGPHGALQSLLDRIYERKHDECAWICAYLSAVGQGLHKPASVLLAALSLRSELDLPLFALSHNESHDITAEESAKFVAALHHDNAEPFANHGNFNFMQIVKTITMSIRTDSDCKRHFLLTEVGSIRIGDRELHGISNATGISMNRLRHFTQFNRDFDPMSHFGTKTGLVGPFPDSVKELDGLIYLRPQALRSADPATTLVAIRYTPFDTVFMSYRIFEALLTSYAAVIGLPVFPVETVV